MPMAHALMRSLNTVAVGLSLDVGRDKVVETAHKVGLTHIQKTCSIALGDQGTTPLVHTGGYAVLANGGMSVTPYAIEEVRNASGDLLYTHERDAPKPKRLFPLEKIEQLNSMLGLVVTSGTGKAAQLDFTTAAGKTGTSSAWRDAWFMGFTGQYVTGVWFGNDDYTPTAGLTGGNLPAMTWKEYMTYAHGTFNIPQIPGLPLHPAQIAEQKRLEELRENNPAVAAASGAGNLMPEETRKTLKALETALQRASGKSLEPAPAERGADAGGGRSPDSTPKAAEDTAGRRASLQR
jgi:penicillin-binding protein 1A